jgi:hypothetical protein
MTNHPAILKETVLYSLLPEFYSTTSKETMILSCSFSKGRRNWMDAVLGC